MGNLEADGLEDDMADRPCSSLHGPDQVEVGMIAEVNSPFAADMNRSRLDLGWLVVDNLLFLALHSCLGFPCHRGPTVKILVEDERLAALRREGLGVGGASAAETL